LSDVAKGYGKYREVLMLVENNYVDSVNTDELVDFSIAKMLEKLDPHTAYFNTEEATAARSQLESGFDGIGVEFNIYNDTVYVVTPLSGGPSETAGIQSGDRIISVNKENLSGPRRYQCAGLQTVEWKKRYQSGSGHRKGWVEMKK
jgi:carboxyl-terminal processing protease